MNVLKKFCPFVLVFIILAVSVYAQTDMYVGYSYDGEYMYKDEHGQYKGYEVEYLYNIAQRAGWKIHFVDYDNWNICEDKLAEGKLDILAGVVKTPEREKRFLFSEKRMGASFCSLFVRNDDTRYAYGDTASFDGMRIGVEQDTIAEKEYVEWCSRCSNTPYVIRYDSLTLAFKALSEGLIDGVATGGEYAEPGMRLVCKYSPLDFYFAFPKKQTTIKKNIDSIMAEILYQDPLYELSLYNQYFGETRQGRPFFSVAETAFLNSSGIIRIAVLMHDAPFSYLSDKGETVGIIPDYLNFIAGYSGIRLAFIPFDSYNKEKQALSENRVDMIGLYRNDLIEANSESFVLSAPYVMMSVVEVTKADTVHIYKAAIPGRDSSFIYERIGRRPERLLLNYYINSEQCFAALLSGKADAVICELPTATWFLNHRKNSGFQITPVPSCNWQASCALHPGNTKLLSIMNKSIIASGRSINELIARNAVQDSYVSSNPIYRLQPELLAAIAIVFIIITGVLVCILFGMIRRRR